MWSNMSNCKTYTLHFDGSHTNQFQKSGAGCIIRDNKGDLVVAASYNLGDTHPDSMMNVAIAEATALSNGLKLAQSFKIKLDFIKGDNKQVIDQVRGQASRVPKPSLSNIIEEIKAALRVQNIDPFFKIELISREGNGVADILASEGSKLWSEERVYKNEDDLPAKAAKLVREEKSLYGGGGVRWVGGGGSCGGNGGSRNFNAAKAAAQLVREEKSLYGGGGGVTRGGNGGFRNFNSGLSTDYGSSSNSDSAETIVKAGAAIAGIATVAWGISKLFSGSGSNDQPENNRHNQSRNS